MQKSSRLCEIIYIFQETHKHQGSVTRPLIFTERRDTVSQDCAHLLLRLSDRLRLLPACSPLIENDLGASIAPSGKTLYAACWQFRVPYRHGIKKTKSKFQKNVQLSDRRVTTVPTEMPRHLKIFKAGGQF